MNVVPLSPQLLWRTMVVDVHLRCCQKKVRRKEDHRRGWSCFPLSQTAVTLHAAALCRCRWRRRNLEPCRNTEVQCEVCVRLIRGRGTTKNGQIVVTPGSTTEASRSPRFLDT